MPSPQHPAAHATGYDANYEPEPLAMTSVRLSLPRVFLVAQQTWRQAARQRVFHFLMLIALTFVLGAHGLRDFNFGAPELRFLADCGFGALTCFGSALSIAATAQLFGSEIENCTVLTLLARPIRRAEFVLGKYLGVLALLGAYCALLTVVILAVLLLRQEEIARGLAKPLSTDSAVSVAAIALAAVLQWLKFAVLAAFTLLVASFAQTQLFTVVTGCFIFVIGHLQYLAQEAYARGGESFGYWLGRSFASVFPNFQVFTAADPLAVSLSGGQLVRIGLYGLGYVGIACALAVFCFRRREL